MNAIEWLTHDEFMRAFEGQKDRVHLEELVNCEIPFEKAKALIPLAPLDSPPGTEDYPGPVSEWYGRTNNLLFIITAHTGPTVQSIDVSIQPNKNRAYCYKWQQLENLSEFPSSFLDSIRWINCGKNVFAYSLERKFDGNSYCVYQGDTEVECTELLKFLTAYGSRFQLEVKKLPLNEEDALFQRLGFPCTSMKNRLGFEQFIAMHHI